MQPPASQGSRRIRVLPTQLANMIAAGEVIERPSAVVKELVENALDAGATRISVELVAGGRRLVQVSDDGCGMNGDDALLAFERHATSKISVPDDLKSILTYGFRGEALPSIASVSRAQLQTCPDESGIGTEVIIEGGQLRAAREVGRARGTTVIVRDLFFNTPARRKFLRSEATELRHVVREITGLGLGSPGLGFRLSHGGRELLECHPVQTWQERVQSLFGREILVRGVELERSGKAGRVFGLLGRPGDAGSGFTEQFLLVNGRPVQSRLLRKAVFDGYEATLESGNQPFFLVFLEIDPAAVDVNVHPQKREARFRDEGEVFRFVVNAVRETFAETGAREPHLAPARLPIDERREPHAGDVPAQRDHRQQSGVPRFWRSGKEKPPERESPERKLAARIAEGEHAYRPDGLGATLKRPPKAEASELQTALNLVSREEVEKPPEGEPEADITGAESHLWQFQQKYIFVSTPDGLWIIDQHIAHERVLYEEAMAAFAGETPASQRLLFPLTLELTPEQDAIFDEVQPMLKSMGFGLERLSGHSIMVDAYPGSVQGWADGQFLRQMIDEVAQVGFKRTGIKEQLAAAYACHAAIKAGDSLSLRTMRWLIERLFMTSMPYVCPHGRPIIVKIDMAEFDSRFGRA